MDRMLLVDDHAMVRAGYRRLLELAGWTGECVECANAEQALTHVRIGAWRLMILDLDLPGRSGLDLLRRVHQARPDVPVLIASGLPEEQFALSALRSGARGFISKNSSPDEFAAAVMTVLDGGRYIGARAAELLADMVHDERTSAPHEQLTAREFEILLKLARGTETGRIAQELHLSAKTVSTYRARILSKLKLASNGELTTYALRRGLIQ